MRTVVQFNNILKSSLIDTKLGQLIAIASEKALYLLEFVNYPFLEWEIERLKKKTNTDIVEGINKPIQLVKDKLKDYFEGKLKEFKTPLAMLGSPFQKLTWEELKKIPYGTTRSYSKVAKNIGHSSAYRAVANANGANKFVIIVPCHRVINNNGQLGGYSSGLERKKWLLEHELKFYAS